MRRKHRQFKPYQQFLFIFLVLNVVNTYFLTTKTFNRYIAPFDHTWIGEFTAVLGNVSVLILFIIIAEILFKSIRARMITLTTITFVMNAFLFVLGIFNLYYGTAFSINTLTILNNPSSGFATQTAFEALKELFTYYRIIVFIPFFSLLIFTGVMYKKLKHMQYKRSVKRAVTFVLGLLLIMISTSMTFMQQVNIDKPTQTSMASYANQNYGVYPYYLNTIFGLAFDFDEAAALDINNDDDTMDLLESYNKNVSSYINVFDQQTYSNRLTVDQAEIDYIDPDIQNGNQLQGIFEDKNLVLIHLESLNYFLLENEYTREQMSFLVDLLSESYAFTNFYTNVGMGVSSDAESLVLTGLNPSGHQTMYWDYNETQYELPSLVNYFNQDQYYTEAIHGDTRLFYNREVVYNGLYGFNDFYSLEDFIEDGYDVNAGFVYDTENEKTHKSPWVSDYYLADYVSQLGTTIDEPYFLFPITMMGHTPFDFGPLGESEDVYPMYAPFVQDITLRYLNYANYYSDIIQRFFIADDEQDQTLDDTVYVFFSDHGSSLKNGDLDILYDTSLSDLEERQILQQTLAFIYAPSNDEYVDFGDYQIRKGMLVGNQDMVRSEVDLYRTIIELFNLDVGDDMYFGVNGLSKEPTFALDNRVLDVVLDEAFYSMRNSAITEPGNIVIDEAWISYIKTYKMFSDYLLSEEDMVKRLNDKLNNT